jgi:hypothetical protein
LLQARALPQLILFGIAQGPILFTQVRALLVLQYASLLRLVARRQAKRGD